MWKPDLFAAWRENLALRLAISYFSLLKERNIWQLIQKKKILFSAALPWNQTILKKN